MKAARRIGVATVLALASALPAQRDGAWSRFRGPNGTGIATSAVDLPVKFGVDENVVWKLELPLGHSSPVLSAAHVFVTAVDDGALCTYCIDRKTGEVAWRREAPRPRTTSIDKRNNAASPTPAVDEDFVCVFFPDCGMLAYDHSGEELWQLPLGPFENEYGMGASPVLDEERVYLPCDQNQGSYLVAVDRGSGEQSWRTDRPRATSGHCTPVFFRPEDGTDQLVLPGSFLLDAYDVRNGARAWWVDGLAFEMKSVPVLRDGIIYINGYASPLNQPGNQVEVPTFAEVIAENDADGDGLVDKPEMPKSRAAGFFDFVDLGKDGALDESDWDYLRAALASQNGMLAIRAGGEGNVTESNSIWAYRRSVPQLPSPLIYGDVLYMLGDQGGLLTTLDPDSGKRLTRGRLRDAIDSYYASPVAGDDKVYFVSEHGLITVLPKGGSLDAIAVSDLGENCYATPAIDGRHLFLRTTKRLYCFGRQN